VRGRTSDDGRCRAITIERGVEAARVVVLVLLEGMPQKDAAEVLGCSEGTVAWRVHEARRRLREKLGDLLDEATGKSSAGAVAAPSARRAP
jgi:predicted DNA-binding protein (UPF0251 family)